MFVIAVILMVVVGLSLVFVGKSARKHLEEIDMTGEHSLRHIEHNEGTNGSFRCFFGVSGQVSSEQQLRFFWNGPEGAVYATTLPYSKFRFEIDNSKETPTAEFAFTDRFLRKRAKHAFYPEAEIINPNYLLERAIYYKGLRAVVVRISEEDLKQEVYLPE